MPGLTKQVRMPRSDRRRFLPLAMFIAVAVTGVCFPWWWEADRRAVMTRSDAFSVASDMRGWPVWSGVPALFATAGVLLSYVIEKFRRIRPPAFPAGCTAMFVVYIVAPQVPALIFHRQLYGGWDDGGVAEPISRGAFDALRWAWRLLGVAFVACCCYSLVWGKAAREMRRHRDELRGRRCCARCGYDLTGNTSGVCPECGTPARPISSDVLPGAH